MEKDEIVFLKACRSAFKQREKRFYIGIAQ